MKSRSSTGVGMKIDLEYNIETMRISDEGGEDGEGATSFRPNNPQPSAHNIMSQLKTSSSVISSDMNDESMGGTDTKKVVADVQGNRLKAMLRDVRKNLQ
jgi:hypothetical protein